MTKVSSYLKSQRRAGAYLRGRFDRSWHLCSWRGLTRRRLCVPRGGASAGSKNISLRLALIAVLVALSGTVAGCTGRTAEAFSASPSRAGSANTQSIGAQAQTAAPATRSAAISAATAIVDADQKIAVEILEQRIPPSSISEYETGKWLKSMKSFLDNWGDEPTPPPVAGQSSVWVRFTRNTSVAPVENSGKTYPNGRVTMTGCFRIRDVFLFVSDGTQVPPSYDSAEFVPYGVSVQYQPSQRVWLVSDETYAPKTPDSPLCP